MEKIYSFSVSYGMFTENLSYGELNLCMKISHRKTVCVELNGQIEMQISCITGNTPKTYYSGNRKYGKYIFIVPENIKVVKKEFYGDSNDEAVANNTTLLKGGTHSATSFGFDFYKITKHGDEEISMEVSKKITKIELSGFGSLDEKIFIENMMPCNLTEVIPNFHHQTSGWKRNEDETHLHAVERIKGISCFVPFAASTCEIEEIPGVETRYLKCINGKSNSDRINE